MLRDVFYYGKKPNVHPRERHAKNLSDARQQSRTDHFWIINEYCDYKNFDWEFDFDLLPDDDVWAEEHNNVWPSQHQKDSGTWLCSKKESEIIIYRNDVDIIKRKNEVSNNWKILENIDTTKWDFSWHPDPSAPPYIYQWGTKFFPVELKACLEYHVEGATQIKYMNTTVELLPNYEYIKEFQKIDKSRYDMSWRPDPMDPPFIYVWGNKYIDGKIRSTLEYHVPGATEKKYMPELIPVLPEWDRWHLLHDVEKTTFDFCWRPDPREPDFIYVFGNEQYDSTVMPTIEYRMPNATVKKYVHDAVAKLSQHPEKFQHLEKADGIDYSWIPDPTSPPYIYAWGNQWNKPEDKISIQYVVEGATEYKYMKERAIRKPCMDNWEVPKDIDTTGFDFSWEPSPADNPYIYQFGTQWQKDGGPRYVVKGATEIKYIDIQKAKALPTTKNWILPTNVDFTDFDFSWHPDNISPPYIYQFGTQWALTGGPKYVVEDAIEVKYMEFPVAKALPNVSNWIVPDYIDVDSFDFSWHPYVEDQPYIYVFGTQHQKTGGPKYITPGADEMSPVKYIDRRIIKSKAKPNKEKFSVLNNNIVADFDYSWHHDETEEPYIYVFGNQYWSAEKMPTVEYHVEGATQYKYINTTKATLGPNKANWHTIIPIDETKWDYTWIPDPGEPPYIYVWGNQWNPAEVESTVEYHVPGATEKKYMNDKIAIVLPDRTNWTILEPMHEDKFDFSWRPNPYEDPYVYTFGNNLYPAEEMPTLEYKVPTAKQRKYVNDFVAQLAPDMRNWEIPEDVDTTGFDFSWKPHPMAPAFIYEFGTQHQKTGGPRYVIAGAKEINYISGYKVIRKPNKKDTNWQIPKNVDISDFDFSWHPDSTEKPYIYQFGTQWALSGGPKYVVPGATEIKYIDNPIAKAKSDRTNWQIPDDIDSSTFDFSWHPYVDDQPYIYQFGTQWQKTGGPRYITPGADDMSPVKYIDRRILKATKLPNKKNFTVLDNNVIDDFDYSWHPDETDGLYIYMFGNNLYPAEIMPTVKYEVEGATKIKYVHDPVAKLGRNYNNWKILLDIDRNSFDFSWKPNPKDPPYIYVWGNQWNPAELEPSIEYHVEGATERKYVTDTVATVLPNKSNWQVLHNIIENEFDFSWRPDPTDPAYIYVFGNQHHSAEKMPTVLYIIPGATEKKYINSICAKLTPKHDNWREILPIEKTSFDYSWVPDPYDPPYIYVFGNQWNDATIDPTIEYVVPGSTERKYITDKVARLLPQPKKFEKLLEIDDFDFSWRPNPKDPAYIYVFGNQWNKAEKEPTVKYQVKGATEFKYVNDIVAVTRANMSLWEIPEDFAVENFDFSWRPDPYDPAYIYEFATEYADRGGPRYKVDGATEIKYMSHIKAKLKAKTIPKYYIETTIDDLVKEHNTEVFWALQKSINYEKFDFNWRPTKDQEQYVHVFGSPEAEKTQTYYINGTLYTQGFTDKNFVEQEKKADTEYLAELFVQPDIFLVDRGNPETQARYEQLKSRFTNVSKTRFLNSWVDTINRCINRSNTELCWILNSELDYTDFDFKYYPNPWQMKMVHVFGTQWSHWGTTFMVNRDTFTEDTKYIKIIEHLSNLNFVKDRRAIATNNLYDIIVINHGNKECDKVVASLESRACGKKVTVVDYETSYVNTLKKIVNNLNAKKEQFVWITSSVCSYGEFDFTYICDPFAKDSLHVFPSDRQKFGDTFLLDTYKAKEFIDSLDLLQQYPKVNYNQAVRAKRLSAPVIKTGQDSHLEAIKSDFDFPYAIFQTEDITAVDNEPMNLWAPDTKSILITSTGGTRIIVPKEAKDFVKDQLYDYPYIKTASKLLDSKPLDIVFLSNGEKCADENYEHLLAVTKDLKNRVVRVDGVNGRVDAYHAAVKASQTNWAFTVFAKLKVDSKFDWNWQPDRLQMPKHYIFHAKNSVNGLEYGHQGMIAYNKALTLNNFGDGLDFTLDDPHETVEILSGVATFNTDSYSTWRTAFREVIKLKSDYTDISQERLQVWLTKAKGKFAKDCLQGANDAVEYYVQVNGDIDQLKLSYEWDWLKDYYNRKYK